VTTDEIRSVLPHGPAGPGIDALDVFSSRNVPGTGTTKSASSISITHVVSSFSCSVFKSCARSVWISFVGAAASIERELYRLDESPFHEFDEPRVMYVLYIMWLSGYVCVVCYVWCVFLRGVRCVRSVFGLVWGFWRFGGSLGHLFIALAFGSRNPTFILDFGFVLISILHSLFKLQGLSSQDPPDSQQ